MKEKEWLDIFYNYVVPEALNGKVDCYMKYNLIFNTIIPEKGVAFFSHYDNFDLLVPTLIIRNKNEFDSLLVTYIKKALDFYDDSNYIEEILTGKLLLKEMEFAKKK